VSRETKAAVALLFTMCVWGLSPVFVRVLSVELKPANALVIRYVSVAVIFASLLAFGRGWRIARPDWPRIILASLVGMLGYNIGSVYGFELAPASIGGLIIGTQPLLIVLFAALIGREPLNSAAILGMIVAFSGTILLFWGELSYSGDNLSLIWGGFSSFSAAARGPSMWWLQSRSS
jgi:drug/metabolite transporter (DMT)-like permease